MSYFFISSIKLEVLISCPFTIIEVIKRKNVSIVFICSLVVLSMHANGQQYVFVTDFEALSCQNRRKYIRFRNAETHTVSAIKHTACYRLAFYSISPSIHLSVNPCSSNNFFVSSAFLFPITMSMFGSLSIQIL